MSARVCQQLTSRLPHTAILIERLQERVHIRLDAFVRFLGFVRMGLRRGERLIVSSRISALHRFNRVPQALPSFRARCPRAVCCRAASTIPQLGTHVLEPLTRVSNVLIFVRHCVPACCSRHGDVRDDPGAMLSSQLFTTPSMGSPKMTSLQLVPSSNVW